MDEEKKEKRGGRRPGAGKPRGSGRKLRPPAIRRKLLALIRRGVSLDVACASVGSSDTTLRAEIKRDEGFAQQVRQARAAKVVAITDLVFEHAKKDPKTAMHLLSILDPAYVIPKETQTHVHAHADVPPRVIFEIIDKRPGADSLEGPSNPSGFLE